MALSWYEQLRATGGFAGEQSPIAAALAGSKRVERSFSLLPALESSSGSFRGGGYGEIHRRYMFGGPRPPVNFHAQQVCFGVDQEGLCYLRAVVGRFDGMWGNTARLEVTLRAGDADVATLAWSGELDPPRDVRVVCFQRSDAARDKFSALTDAQVRFDTLHRG
jgi:hypothetical protein